MIRAVAVLVLISGVAHAQSTSPQFDVASIKPSIAATGNSSGMNTGHGRLRANNVTLKRCIMGAWSVGPHQIFGGPDWLDSDRFEIVAKSEQDAGDAVINTMLQNLLAERFKLALHRETRTIQAFVLEVAKNGPKLENATGGESSTNVSGSNDLLSLDARNTSMDLFREVLARWVDLPVVNQTGLEGVFNFKLEWARDNARSTDAPSIFTALQEQLGLRLRSEKAPVEVLVIDHAEKPSEN